MTRRFRLGLCLFVFAGSFVGRSAQAETATLFIGAPEVDPSTGELAVIAGAQKPDGSPAKLTDAQLLLDDQRVAEAVGEARISFYAADHAKWVPPIAVGIVYLWAQGGPDGVMDGVETLCKRLPGRASVYPTPYGQGYRPVITRIPAARAAAGDLADYAPLQGDQYKLLDAIRFNVSKLADDEAPIKYLVIITDGRDLQNDRGAFATLGDELRRKHLRVAIVSVRPPVDSVPANANLGELARAARAVRLAADRGTDLPPLTESVADAIGGLLRLRFVLPWSARTFGGTRQVGLAASVDGAPLSVQDGTVTIPGGAGSLLLIALGGVVALAVLGWGGYILWNRRGQGGGDNLQQLYDELHDLVRLGTPAEQAVVELSQRFPDDVAELLKLDPQKLNPTDYRFLRTRAGQARLKEIQALLAEDEDRPAVDDEMAAILADAVRQGSAAEDVAQSLRARLPDTQWGAFSRVSGRQVKESLRDVSRHHAELGSVKAAEFASQVQVALRQRQGAGLAVAWLVRAGGPGRRGETLRLPAPSAIIGSAVTCQPRLSDDQMVADEHAEIQEAGGQFIVRPRRGVVSVEGSPIAGDHTLADGETLTLGTSRFVFKTVVVR
jgi:hypothetical protein